MSAKAQEENVKKLVALGFSKTKAQKALKDTGNSFPRAKEMLERQQQAAEKEAAQQEIIRKRQEEEEEKKRILAEQKLLAAANNASSASSTAAATAGVPASSAGNNLAAGDSFQYFFGLNHSPPFGDVESLGVPHRQQYHYHHHHHQLPPSQPLALQTSPHVQPNSGHVRLHPCMVQYKSCRYGRYCLLKDLPGDACINHFHGNCIYGSSCRHRHHVDGVDIRHYVPSSAAGLQPPPDDGVLMRQEDGGLVVHTETIAGGVQLAEVYYPNGPPGRDPSGAGRANHQPLPPEYQWNVVRGSEPSYSDPVQSTASIWAPEIGASLEGAPTPFLDTLRMATPAATVQRPSRQIVHAHDNHAAQLRIVRFGEPGYLAHPCILQCGGCKYGDHCMHASRPADVCVFYLNGRCNYDAHQCRFRHDDSLTMIGASSMAALAQRTQQGGGAGAAAVVGSPSVAMGSAGGGGGGPMRGSPNIGSSSSTTSPPVTFVLKPNAVVGGMSMWSLNESLASREQALLEKQYAPPPPASHRLLHDGHLGGSADGGGGASMQQLHRTPTLVAQYGTSSSPPGSPQLLRQNSQQPPQHQPQSADDERRAFDALCEVFPNVDPPLLLHALRMANGDRRLVANVLAETHANDNDRDLEAFLGAALAEEGSEWHAGCSSDGLLSLLAVFPNLDVPVVEDALRRANNNVSEAFSALVRSTEHISTEGFAGNSWGALGGAPGTSAADQLKLQRLFVMYPELPQEVVQDCFLAANGSSQGCIEALTNLVSEVRTVQERLEEGNRAMRKELSPPSSQSPNTGDDDVVATGSFTVSSDGGGGGVGGFSVTSSTSPMLPSQTDLYHEVAQEASEQGDWRRVREQAYFVNHCRIQLLSMAASCFARGDGRGAKTLSQKAAALGVQYRRLNMIAMRALEEERNGVHAVSMLDLHGFHVDEAIDVLHRRIQLCLLKRVPRLRVVIGRGLHSQRGRSSVFPAVLQELSTNPHLVACSRVTSVKQAFIEVQLLFDGV